MIMKVSESDLKIAGYHSFEQFACEVFLYDSFLSTHFPSYEVNKLIRTCLADDAAYVIGAFADAHCELFRSIFIKHQLDTLETDEDLFKFAIPRCLRLIDEDRYYYSMMLVASFLKELITTLRGTRVCYRFHFTMYKCFAAVYERYFKIFFELEGGWDGLQDFLLETIHDLSVTEEKDIISALNDSDLLVCSKVAKLIENCDDGNVFNLNDYETLLLRDSDVKDILKSIDYTKNEDPLKMIWPLNDEDLNKICNSFGDLELNKTFSYSYAVKEMNSYSTSSNHDEEPVVKENVKVSSQCPAGPDMIKASEGSSGYPTYLDIGNSSGFPKHTDSDSRKDSESLPELYPDSADRSGAKDHVICLECTRFSKPLTDRDGESGSKGYHKLPSLDNSIESKSSHEFGTVKDVENASSDWNLYRLTRQQQPDSLHEPFFFMEDYISNIEAEARTHLGSKKFWKKMKLRVCPCCGIKCFQFSLQLRLKQINAFV